MLVDNLGSGRRLTRPIGLIFCLALLGIYLRYPEGTKFVLGIFQVKARSSKVTKILYHVPIGHVTHVLWSILLIDFENNVVCVIWGHFQLNLPEVRSLSGQRRSNFENVIFSTKKVPIRCSLSSGTRWCYLYCCTMSKTHLKIYLKNL